MPEYAELHASAHQVHRWAAGRRFVAAHSRAVARPDDAPADALARACALGAFVASKPGATPKHDKAAIDAILATA